MQKGARTPKLNIQKLIEFPKQEQLMKVLDSNTLGMYVSIKQILEDYSKQIIIELEKYCDEEGKFGYLQIWNFLKDKEFEAEVSKTEIEELLKKVKLSYTTKLSKGY